jgi:hypothetical protein
MPPLLILLLKIVWTLLALLSAAITLGLFAFADSPDLGKKLARLFYPAIILALAAYLTGANLVYHLAAPWQIPISFLLVLAPPTLVIAAIRLLK